MQAIELETSGGEGDLRATGGVRLPGEAQSLEVREQHEALAGRRELDERIVALNVKLQEITEVIHYKQNELNVREHDRAMLHTEARELVKRLWEDERKLEKPYLEMLAVQAEVDRHVLLRYSRNSTNSSEYDRHSIMQYPVPSALTDGKFEVGWNSELSERDKRFIATIYPR